MRAGMAIKPKTVIDEKVMKILNANILDMVLVMTVGNGLALSESSPPHHSLPSC